MTVNEHVAEAESFTPLVRACLQALFQPIDKACELFDRPALTTDVNRMYSNVVAVVGQ